MLLEKYIQPLSKSACSRSCIISRCEFQQKTLAGFQRLGAARNTLAGFLVTSLPFQLVTDVAFCRFRARGSCSVTFYSLLGAAHCGLIETLVGQRLFLSGQEL